MVGSPQSQSSSSLFTTWPKGEVAVNEKSHCRGLQGEGLVKILTEVGSSQDRLGQKEGCDETEEKVSSHGCACSSDDELATDFPRTRRGFYTRSAFNKLIIPFCEI